jgi:hypothetical protein
VFIGSVDISRRGVLVLIGLSVLVSGLTACNPPAVVTPPAAPSADELSIDRAVAAARQIRGNALRLAGTEPKLASLLNRIAAAQLAQLRALGAEPAASASPSASPTASASASADGSVELTPSELITAEWAAARAALRDGEAAGPAFAVLLCRIAASRAADVDLLGQALGRSAHGVLTPAKPLDAATATPSASGSPSTSAPASDVPATDVPSSVPLGTDDPTTQDGAPTPTVTALNRILAGEHAAVFAYPLVVARIGSRRSLAEALWQEHRNERDRLTLRLLAEDAEPATAAPAYEVGTPPTTPALAAALAAKVERGLAGLASDLIAVATGDDRALGADQLVLAARRAARWTGRPIALPGLTVSASATAAAATPAVTSS